MEVHHAVDMANDLIHRPTCELHSRCFEIGVIPMPLVTILTLFADNGGKECQPMTSATKPRTTPTKKTDKPAAQKRSKNTTPMTEWGKEALRRIEALHKALDGHVLE